MREPPLERSLAALEGVAVLEYGSTLRTAYCGSLLAQLGAKVVALDPQDTEPSAAPIDVCARRTMDGSKLRATDLETATEALGDGHERLVLVLDQARRPPLGLPIAVEVRLAAHEREADARLGGIVGNALSACALAGASVAIGHAARQPLPIPEEFVEHTAGLHGAIAALLALMRAPRLGEDRGGPGAGPRGPADVEPVEALVAIDECLRFYVGMNAKMYENYPREWHREGRRSAGSAGQYPVGMFPCADGYVVIVSRSRGDWQAILAAMGSPAWAERPGWDDPLLVAERHADEADALLEAWLGELSCEQAVALGRRHGFAIARMLEPLQAIATEQMRSRGFGRARPDGAVAVERSILPVIVVRGERTAPAQPPPPRSAGVTPPPVRAALAGLRVLDLSWVWSGPATTMMLAALGAEVIKVESAKRPDGSRLRGRPSIDGVPVPGPLLEVTPYFHQVNAGKHSVELDLGSADGRETVRALADASDVLVENMRPGVLARHGLDYASLSQSNASLVMLSMSLAGQQGPLRDAKGYASIMSALSGLESLVGYGPEDITGMLTVAVGDPNAASYGVLTVLAALLEREQTGRGAWLDLSQLEAVACGLLGTLAAFASDRDAAWGYGNWHAEHAPFGAYPTSDGGWVALAVRAESEWPAFVAALGEQALREPRFSTSAGRRRERAALERLVAAATGRIERAELIERLLAAGVLAVPVLALGEHAGEGFAAPARHAMPMHHPYGEHEVLVTPPWDLDRDRPRFSTRAPLLGEHTEAVLKAVLGRAADGAAGTWPRRAPTD